MKAIINGKIITKDEILENKVLLFDKKINKIVENINFNKDNLEIIDAKRSYVSPGFIDVHIHGSNGKDVMDGEIESLEIMSKFVSSKGVTAFLPTTMTMSKERIYKALDTIKEASDRKLSGASIIGAHLEGPFINEKYKGAQKSDYILKPNYDFIKKYKDIIKLITMAPEEDENFNFIKEVKKNSDIVLSIGHSDATYEQAMEAIKLGANHITHTFNVMSPLNHRKPGVVGAAFDSDAFCEIIADTIHTHPSIFSILLKIKGKEKVVLITDCMRAGGLKDGVSELGGQKVFVKDNSARLESGALAGSILTLNKAIKNVYENTDLTINEAVNLATINPAKSINIYDKKGSLEEGKDADITIFNDKFEVIQTIVGGETVYEN
ncbi:N-acetylglucosamine-6-phosphate deacetylase [Clostridium hydrogenum]|uniref:N-acetylglucosamine-6-phosphate deacetylase n=1 Tax=Clostridium hydrogenum TaxID=2855764 RepID=UPI001F366370|nr:N-acetylglucosamine-6-phosphate deacetylase [Clostridium hydrogenum]